MKIKAGTVISQKQLYRIKAAEIHKEENSFRRNRNCPIQPDEIDWIKKALNVPDVNLFISII